MVILDGTIVIVALPSIQADLGFSEQGLQWVLSAYALTFGGLLLLGGRAADLLGRRRVFMAGVLLFTAASLVCGLAWSPAALLAARVVQGVGAAIMTPTALSIISTTFPEGSERNKALGIWGALGGIGATAAWLIGGPLVDGPGWEWIFFINIPLGLAALALSPLLLRESRAALTRRSYDPAGALTITGALVLLVYAVVEAPDVGWGDATDDPPARRLGRAPRRLRADRVAPPRAARAAPPPPLANARRRERRDAPHRHRRGRHAVRPHALRAAGARLLGPQVRGQLGRARGCGHGRRDRRLRPRSSRSASGRSPRRGMALMGAGSLLLTQVSVGGSYFGDIFFGLLVVGPGIGLAFVTATVAALAGVAEHESGLASGLSNTALQIGAALGVAIVTTVAVSRSEDYLAANEGANPLVVLTEGFQSAFLACVVLAGIGLALALLLLGRPRKARAGAGAVQRRARTEPQYQPSSGDSHAKENQMGKIVISENVTLDGVVQDPAGDEGFRVGGWVGLIKDRPEARQARARRGPGRRGPAAGSAELRVVRRAVAIPEWRVGGQVEQPAQVRRVLDPRGSRLEQLDGTQGRRGGRRSRS